METKAPYYFYVLVNPGANAGKGAQVWEQVRARLDEDEIPYEVILTTSSEHVRETVQRLNTGEEDISLVVLGGDGTLSTVIDAVTDFDHVRIGYIPAGSANDFARDVKLSRDPLENLSVILRGEIVRVLDYGLLQYHDHLLPSPPLTREIFRKERRFNVSAGIGFDAGVCAGVLQSRRRRLMSRLGLSDLMYLFVALRIIFGTKQEACDLILDDRKHLHLDRALLIAGMLHSYEGGGFYFAPEADATDGALDLLVAGDISAFRFLRALPLAYKGTHTRLKGIDLYRAQKIEIRMPEPVWVHTDGEVIAKSTHITLTCAQQRIRMLN